MVYDGFQHDYDALACITGEQLAKASPYANMPYYRAAGLSDSDAGCLYRCGHVRTGREIGQLEGCYLYAGAQCSCAVKKQKQTDSNHCYSEARETW